VLGANGFARGAISILWPSRGVEVDRKRLRNWPRLLRNAMSSLQGL
jgi:hypothetical protein